MATTITIDGMHCDACERTLTRALEKGGVHVKRIDHTNGTAVVEPGERTKEEIADIIRSKGYTPLEGKRPAKNAPSEGKWTTEMHILRNSAISLLVLLAIQALLIRTVYANIDGWSSQYAIPLLLVPVAIVVNMAAIWHQRAYRRDVSCMTGMMVGMTIGMSAGLMIGEIAGLLNGMFWGATIGLVVGIAAGVYAGRCCGIMGVMEGVMAGFMGGTMGAMLTVMMILEHPVVFIIITMIVGIVTLAGIMRVVASEHEDARPQIAPWPLRHVLLISGAISILLSLIMLALPHWLY